jgi:hypothetical protein
MTWFILIDGPGNRGEDVHSTLVLFKCTILVLSVPFGRSCVGSL